LLLNLKVEFITPNILLYSTFPHGKITFVLIPGLLSCVTMYFSDRIYQTFGGTCCLHLLREIKMLKMVAATSTETLVSYRNTALHGAPTQKTSTSVVIDVRTSSLAKRSFYITYRLNINSNTYRPVPYQDFIAYIKLNCLWQCYFPYSNQLLFHTHRGNNIFKHLVPFIC